MGINEINEKAAEDIFSSIKEQQEQEIKNFIRTFDSVRKPSHYNQHGIEAIMAIEASMSPEEFKGYLKGNTLKYIWRYSYKGKALEDLEKAEQYLFWLIQRVKHAKS